MNDDKLLDIIADLDLKQHEYLTQIDKASPGDGQSMITCLAKLAELSRIKLILVNALNS